MADETHSDREPTAPAKGPDRCPLCGADLFGKQCKLVCPTCGYVESCEDIFPTRHYRESEMPER